MKCASCMNMHTSEGFSGSEQTGSFPPSISCGRGRWDFDFSDVRRSLRVIQEIGQDCPEYVHCPE